MDSRPFSQLNIWLPYPVRYPARYRISKMAELSGKPIKFFYLCSEDHASYFTGSPAFFPIECSAAIFGIRPNTGYPRWLNYPVSQSNLFTSVQKIMLHISPDRRPYFPIECSAAISGIRPDTEYPKWLNYQVSQSNLFTSVQKIMLHISTDRRPFPN